MQPSDKADLVEKPTVRLTRWGLNSFILHAGPLEKSLMDTCDIYNHKLTQVGDKHRIHYAKTANKFDSLLLQDNTRKQTTNQKLFFYLKCWRYPAVALYNCSLHKYKQDKEKYFGIVWTSSIQDAMLMFKWHTRCHSFIMCRIVFIVFVCRSSIETYLKEVKITNG